MRVLCQACNGVCEVPEPPPANIMNYASCSVIVAEHPQEFTCGSCQTVLVLAVMQVKLALVATPLPAAARRNLIVAPGPM